MIGCARFSRRSPRSVCLRDVNDDTSPEQPKKNNNNSPQAATATHTQKSQVECWRDDGTLKKKNFYFEGGLSFSCDDETKINMADVGVDIYRYAQQLTSKRHTFFL